MGSPLRGSPSSLPYGRSVRTPLSGEGGIRTPKPVRAPVFETGALPFCHLSKCRTPLPCWVARPVKVFREGDSCQTFLGNSRGRLPASTLRTDCRVGSKRVMARTHEAAHLQGCLQTDGVGFEPTRQGCCPHALQACALVHSATRPKKASGCWPGGLRRGGGGGMGSPLRGSPSSLPAVARFEPTRLSRVTTSAGVPPHSLSSASGGGGGIRTHETLSSQRLSRAPP